MGHLTFFPIDDDSLQVRDSRNFLYLDGRTDATSSAGSFIKPSDDILDEESEENQNTDD
jgi:hypothetical protein